MRQGQGRRTSRGCRRRQRAQCAWCPGVTRKRTREGRQGGRGAGRSTGGMEAYLREVECIVHPDEHKQHAKSARCAHGHGSIPGRREPRRAVHRKSDQEGRQGTLEAPPAEQGQRARRASEVRLLPRAREPIQVQLQLGRVPWGGGTFAAKMRHKTARQHSAVVPATHRVLSSAKTAASAFASKNRFAHG